ncbi:MAG: hypothetical protein M3124_01880 [Actinomycetota bacterium]|nr:hypothetical protein [Actinomycetota bacterium]
MLLAANPDLLVGDLLKATSSSQTFRLFASPDVTIKSVGDAEVTVEVIGIDSFDAATGELVSRSQADVAAWFFDQDYEVTSFPIVRTSLSRASTVATGAPFRLREGQRRKRSRRTLLEFFRIGRSIRVGTWSSFYEECL